MQALWTSPHPPNTFWGGGWRRRLAGWALGSHRCGAGRFMGAARQRLVMVPHGDYTRYLSCLPPLNKHRQSPPARPCQPGGIYTAREPSRLPSVLRGPGLIHHPARLLLQLPPSPAPARGRWVLLKPGVPAPKVMGPDPGPCWGSPAPNPFLMCRRAQGGHTQLHPSLSQG